MEHDTLSMVLDHLGVEGTVFCRAELDAPWAVETRGTPTAMFHVVVRGSGYARVGDAAPVPWRAGDLLLLPRGAPHVMSSEPEIAPVHIGALPTSQSDDGLPCLVTGGDGPHTSLLCGTVAIGRDAELLVSELPELVHVEAAHSASSFFDATLRLLADEVGSGRPGARSVVTRLAEILLVHALRAWLATEARDSRGWLGALTDPVLSRALAQIHQQPEREWTTAELAHAAGVSRSVLYDRFAARLDASPAAYLTRWRMTLARRALAGGDSVGEVASAVGYGSEAAFSRAFKREVGASPTAWRREASEA